jgi:FK506-binding nuclear protein
MPVDDGHNQRHEIYDDEDDVDYDLSPDEAELDGSSETDELDDLQDPRITELGSEEDDEPPKLIKKGEPGKGNKKEEPAKGNKKDESAKGDKKEDSAKGNKKRVAEDSDEEPANLDDIMAKALKPADAATNGEPKLSKKQLKKLKNNAGKAVQAAVENKGVEKTDEAAKDNANSKADKKVQFAKDLEQGPSSTVNDTKSNNAAEAKTESKKDGEKPKATLGPRTVQGVEIDDRKLGKGPAAKNGSKVSMRYIGKLQDGKVFDGNCI